MDIIKDIENNILVNATDEEKQLCTKHKKVLENSYNNSIPLMLKSKEKMDMKDIKRNINHCYLYFRIHPLLIKILLIIMTTLSIFYNKYIIISGLIILSYSLLNWFYDSLTYPKEVNYKLIYPYDLFYRQIKWLKFYDVEIRNNVNKKDVEEYINDKNEEIKKEYNFDDEQLQKFLELNDDELYDDLQEKINNYKIVIYTDVITKKYKSVRIILFLIYLLGITNKVYNIGLINNSWLFDKHNILYDE